MNLNGILRAGAILGAAGVMLGAFGAHGLRGRLTGEMLDIFEVGVRYHMYHALALVALGAGVAPAVNSLWARRAAWCWAVGILVFSGSLYMLALTEERWLGAVTPFGGVALILGWLAVAAATIQRKA